MADDLGKKIREIDAHLQDVANIQRAMSRELGEVKKHVAMAEAKSDSIITTVQDLRGTFAGFGVLVTKRLTDLENRVRALEEKSA